MLSFERWLEGRALGTKVYCPNVAHILNDVHHSQLLTTYGAVTYVGVEELGFLVGQVVLKPGEKRGPGGAGVGHRPVGTRWGGRVVL